MTTHYWVDGVPSTPGATRLDPAAPLVAWGEGFFETARTQAGTILALPLHMNRMRQSLETFYREAFDDRLFERVWSAAEQAANLAEIGRLRVVANPTTSAAHSLRFITTFTEWSPPSEADYHRGVNVDFTSLAHPRLGAIGKSTSYHWARLGIYEARRRQLDDVIFTARDSVIETTTASILCFDGRTWTTPAPGSGGLDSTTIRALELEGLSVHRAPLAKSDIEAAESIALVSALRLAMGIRALGDRTFTEPDKHVRPLRDLLLSSATSAE